MWKVKEAKFRVEGFEDEKRVILEFAPTSILPRYRGIARWEWVGDVPGLGWMARAMG